MHKLGFKIVERLGDMTLKQKLFFQYAILNDNQTIEEKQKSENYQRSKDIVDRSRKWRQQ